MGVILRSDIVAQGTLYFSNFGESPVINRAVGNDSWLAQYFITGPHLAGYVLNSAQLLMATASGSPSGFSVSIYSKLTPTNYLGNLNGSDPSAGGIFTYTASGIMLLPSTGYYVVVTASTPVAQGSYNWSQEMSGTGIGANGWGLQGFLKSSDGSSWSLDGRGRFYQLALYATAVPEPSSFALLGLASAWLLARRLTDTRGKKQFQP